MGDFYVPAATIKDTIRLEIVPLKAKQFSQFLDSISDEQIRKEREADKERFEIGEMSEEAYTRSLHTGLALQKWVEQENLGAWSYNFLDINPDSGMETVPFLQASKLMGQGVGFGGGGDLLIASLIGSLAYGNPDTSFSKMFCPGWKNDSIYLSHMGEFNYKLAEGKATLMEMDYKYSEAESPDYAAGRFRPGEILLVDVLPLGESY